MKLDPKKTALLTLDFQKGIFGFVAAAEAVVPAAAKAVEFARRKQFHIIHVGLGFSAGHPEIPETESRFKRVKESNLFVRPPPNLTAPSRARKISWSTNSASARFRRTSCT
jgi:nicotinamidase-related amidase